MRRTTPIDEDAIAWSHPRGARAGSSLIVFLHGYSGNESDWSAWFPALPGGVVGASLRGPDPVGDRWAWVHVDRSARSSGSVVAEFSAVARGVLAWVERLDVERVALVGWSQGGAMAVHLIRQQPDRFVAAAVVAGFVADTRPHTGVRLRRPPVWYGMGGRDRVISSAMQTRSRRWLSEHTAATLVDLPDEDHMLSEAFAGAAVQFTAAALASPG